MRQHLPGVAHGGPVAGRIHLHEVGEVGHAGELVEVGGRQVLRGQDQRDPEVLLRRLHRAPTVLQSVEDETRDRQCVCVCACVCLCVCKGSPTLQKWFL